VRAIATAQTRLLIASHRVTIHGLSEYLLEGIVAAALRGVQVRLCYDAAEQAEMDPIAGARLERAHGSGASVSATDTHAKILLCDDWVVVSSHNFLSLDPGERSAHEVGIQLFETAVVDALWASFGVEAGEKATT
jgi:phosphatidylserine/phosphatidylglycerophosphate/cardiolipin synthase-like enzyme